MLHKAFYNERYWATGCRPKPRTTAPPPPSPKVLPALKRCLASSYRCYLSNQNLQRHTLPVQCLTVCQAPQTLRAWSNGVRQTESLLLFGNRVASLSARRVCSYLGIWAKKPGTADPHRWNLLSIAFSISSAMIRMRNMKRHNNHRTGKNFGGVTSDSTLSNQSQTAGYRIQVSVRYFCLRLSIPSTVTLPSKYMHLHPDRCSKYIEISNLLNRVDRWALREILSCVTGGKRRHFGGNWHMPPDRGDWERG